MDDKTNMASGAVKYRPFKFERSFDTDSAASTRRKVKEEEDRKRQEDETTQEELPPPPPTFSEEELEAAKAAAYQEGHAAGHAQAGQEQEEHIIAALHTITGQLAVLHDRQALANEVIAAELAKITKDIIAKLLPDYFARHGADEIIALVRSCLEPLEDTGRITVKVAPDLQESLEKRLDDARTESGFLGQLVIMPDPGLGLADVRIDWGQGGAERNTETTWKMVEDAIEQAQRHAQAHQMETGAEHEQPGDQITDAPPAQGTVPPEQEQE